MSEGKWIMGADEEGNLTYSCVKDIEVEKLPEHCDYCGYDKFATLIYGFLSNTSDELKEKLRKGEVVWEGCCVEPDSPNYHCRRCGQPYLVREKSNESWRKHLEKKENKNGNK